MPAMEVPNLLKTKKESVRTVRLRLLSTKQQDKRLRKIANTCSKLWNEVNYVRRKAFFEKKKVDLKETYKEYLSILSTIIRASLIVDLYPACQEQIQATYTSAKLPLSGTSISIRETCIVLHFLDLPLRNGLQLAFSCFFHSPFNHWIRYDVFVFIFLY